MNLVILLLFGLGVAETRRNTALKCVDKMIGCHVLGKRGWCKHRADQMRKRCRKTCGFCDLTEPKRLKHHHHHSYSKPSYSISTGVCLDKSTACKLMKTRGWCKHRKGQMLLKCQKTCHYCSNSCEDKRPDCNGLKKIGFCAKRPNKMFKMCQKTCDMCSNGETNEIEVPQAVSSGGCVDSFGQKRCEYYAHIGMCTKNPKFKKICHNTCVCNFKKPKPPTHCKSTKHGCCWDNKTTKKAVHGPDCPVCKDDPRFEVLCRRFGEDCEGSGGLAQSVRRHCPKTCNFCGGKK